MQVVRVEARFLGRPLEQELRVVDDVLVDRRSRGDQDGNARALPPAGPPELLPRRRHRTRVAGEDRDIEPPDVDAELERVRGDDAEDLAIAQPVLDRPTFGWQVAAPVAANAASRSVALAQRFAQSGQQQLDRDPRPPEHDRLAPGAEEGECPPLCEGDGRPARTAGGLHDRRIDKHDVALAGRCPVSVDEACRSPGQHRRQLARVPDRRRAAHDDRVRAVMGADPEEPPKHVGDVAAEHAAIRVQLVDDDHSKHRN